MTPSHVYHISPNYRKATCWRSDSTGRRQCVSTTSPFKSLTRLQRYEVIYGWLRDQFDIIGPAYRKTGAPEDPEVISVREFARLHGLSLADVVSKAAEGMDTSCRGCY